MDNGQFDIWVGRMLPGQSSRRTALHAVVGAVLGGWAATRSLHTAAKRRRKKRKKKKVSFNAFGCVDVSKFCKHGGQCCSGVCEGRKGKKTCQAHDQSTCLPGQDICLDDEVDCTTTADTPGHCATTTGKASYCSGVVTCLPCTKDADCVPFCGAGAACIDYIDCDESGGAACAGLEICTIPI